MQNNDLTKILKDCAIGTIFYSPLFGDVEFQEIFNEQIVTKVCNGSGGLAFFDKNGCYLLGKFVSHESLLFPSSDKRSWICYVSNMD